MRERVSWWLVYAPKRGAAWSVLRCGLKRAREWCRYRSNGWRDPVVLVRLVPAGDGVYSAAERYAGRNYRGPVVDDTHGLFIPPWWRRTGRSWKRLYPEVAYQDPPTRQAAEEDIPF